MSSNNDTRYASAASCSAITADDWNRRSVYNHTVSFVFETAHPHPHLEILSNFSNKSLEGQLPNEQLSRLLVTTNLSQRNSSRTESMRLLHTTSRLNNTQLQVQNSSQNRLTACAVLRADLAASCLRGALPPVDFLAVCLVRAIAGYF